MTPPRPRFSGISRTSRFREVGKTTEPFGFVESRAELVSTALRSQAFCPPASGEFKRRNKTDEFEGTGVGLAVVEKIISRHKGKVWAEGKMNEGAVFYFTVPV